MGPPVALNISTAAITLMGLSVTGLPWPPPGHCKFPLCERHLQQRGADLSSVEYPAPKMPRLRRKFRKEIYSVMKCEKFKADHICSDCSFMKSLGLRFKSPV